MTTSTCARRIHVRGVVQGVGFRPFVFRLAHTHRIGGWVLNGAEGVEIHAEGNDHAIDAFLLDLAAQAPAAAVIQAIDVRTAPAERCDLFEIRVSRGSGPPTTRVSPDLPICAACTQELFDSRNRRAGYPYVNCTDCGPRFSIVLALPYDRPQTTMAAWPLCAACAREYHNPRDRRFHAQPVACPVCGPHYRLLSRPGAPAGLVDDQAIAEAARHLTEGHIVAIKGIGGYHLACDARNPTAVATLRTRKYRKEKPFALMVRDLDIARRVVSLSADAEALLTSAMRPIVLASGRIELPEVAPDNSELGIMLPYAPVHLLLFACGAPDLLVMTSGNRSSEPIAYADEDAFERLGGIADLWLAGERPIARRLEDSVARAGPLGPQILRRARGCAPGAVADLPVGHPILALGGDLKSAITLVVDGQAFGGPHIGDLQHLEAYSAFSESVQDLLSMYDVRSDDLLIAHDAHPQYLTTRFAESLPARRHAVQHHRAHVASVLAERGEFTRRVVGVALDGTGYGDDGSIWGGEMFVGSVSDGFERVAGLRSAGLPGGDAAARHPVQAAAGFLSDIDNLPDLTKPPFEFPERYVKARRLVDAQVRVFRSSSAGRLFDTMAALLGFVRPITFEGQAAMWLEHLSASESGDWALPFEAQQGEIDWRPALTEAMNARRAGSHPAPIARAFHRGLARVLAEVVLAECRTHGLDTVVLSGGVFQNERLVLDLLEELEPSHCSVWMNERVPANDGGLSLGQAAVVACRHGTTPL